VKMSVAITANVLQLNAVGDFENEILIKQQK